MAMGCNCMYSDERCCMRGVFVQPQPCEHCYCSEIKVKGVQHKVCCMCGNRYYIMYVTTWGTTTTNVTMDDDITFTTT